MPRKKPALTLPKKLAGIQQPAEVKDSPPPRSRQIIRPAKLSPTNFGADGLFSQSPPSSTRSTKSTGSQFSFAGVSNRMKPIRPRPLRAGQTPEVPSPEPSPLRRMLSKKLIAATKTAIRQASFRFRVQQPAPVPLTKEGRFDAMFGDLRLPRTKQSTKKTHKVLKAGGGISLPTISPESRSSASVRKLRLESQRRRQAMVVRDFAGYVPLAVLGNLRNHHAMFACWRLFTERLQAPQAGTSEGTTGAAAGGGRTRAKTTARTQAGAALARQSAPSQQRTVRGTGEGKERRPHGLHPARDHAVVQSSPEKTEIEEEEGVEPCSFLQQPGAC